MKNELEDLYLLLTISFNNIENILMPKIWKKLKSDAARTDQETIRDYDEDDENKPSLFECRDSLSDVGAEHNEIVANFYEQYQELIKMLRK